MKKQALCLLLALALTGCAGGTPGGSASQPEDASQPGSASQSSGEYGRRDAIDRPELGTEVVIDPPYDFDPAAWAARGCLC